MRRPGFIFLLLTGAIIGAAACDGGEGTGTGGSSSTQSSTTTTTMGEGAGGTGGTGAGGTGAGGTGAGGQTGGYCARSCTTPADCCLPGQGNCPSDQYPTNWTCDNGICGSPYCQTNEECTFGGQLPGYECLQIGGQPACSKPCTANSDCTGGATCTGMTDTGTLVCKSEVEQNPCVADADCNGFGICQQGACVCHEDSHCTNLVDKCVTN
jgi:hypothetical protein